MEGVQGPQGSADSIFTVTKSIDPRLTQPGHTYNTAQGASAISQVNIAAASNSNTNLTFSIVPSSTNVVVEKAPMLDLVLTFQLLFLQSDGSGVNGNTLINMDPNYKPFAVLGRDWAFARAAPLGQLVQSWTINFNNASVQQQNTALPDLTHLLEGPKGRAGHATNYRIPVFASHDDSAGSDWGLSASIGSMQGEGDIGPGVYNFVYCDGTGTPIPYSNKLQWYNAGGPLGSGAAGPGVPVITPNTTFVQYGVPVTNPNGAGSLHPVYVQVRMIDSITCSPWAQNYETGRRETGLYGLSTITALAQLQPASQSRIIQGSSAAGCVLMNASNSMPGGTAAGTIASMPSGFIGSSGDLMANPKGIQNAKIWLTYLSPTIQSTLPPRSISTLLGLQIFQTTVPGSSNVYSSASTSNNVGGLANPCLRGRVDFSAISFSCIPDLLMISIRPAFASQAATEADFCCTFPDNAFQQFTVANQSGLFSGYTSHALTAMSRQNGSRASLAQYGGADGSGYMMIGGSPVAVGGSVLLIRPGWDFPLPVGTSVGSTGQVQVSFQLLFNALGSNIIDGPIPAGGGAPPKITKARDYVCTLTAISSGYFVTANGVSRQVIVGLDEVTVLNAPMAPDRFAAAKLAGGGFTNGLASSGSAGTEFLTGLKNALVGGSFSRAAASSKPSLGQRAAMAHSAWSASRANTPGNGVSGGSMTAAEFMGGGTGYAGQKRRTLQDRLDADRF